MSQIAQAHPRRRRLLVLIGLLALLPALGFGYQTFASMLDAQNYPPPGQLVDVGGYRLHLYCTGSGSPTVILDAGLGGSWLDWSQVQPALSQTTRVCAYDRAGMGWSDVGPEPRDAQQAVTELHTLLQNAQVEGGLLLVGHSNGGLRTQLYTSRYPADVVGLVLVDPTLTLTPEEQMAALPDETQAQINALLANSEQTAASASPDQNGGLQMMAALAPFGVMRLIGAGLLELSAALPADVRESYRAVSMRSAYLASVLAESRQITSSIEQVRAQTGGFDDLPLTVLVNDLEFSRDLETLSAAEQEIIRLMGTAAYSAGQALADLSAQGQLIIVQDSGHYIQLDRPEIVIQAITQMLEQVK